MKSRPKILTLIVFLNIFSSGKLAVGSEVPLFWAGFYTPTLSGTSSPTGNQAPSITAKACVHEILLAQVKYGIPDNLLLAIGIQEAGKQSDYGLTVWPWTINADGVGQYFETQGKAIARVNELQKSGARSIDIGCMQINQKWHGNAFDDTASAFNPALNVDYAARFLVSLFRSSGDWTKAAGNYHSRNISKQDIYLANLKVNQNYVQSNFSRLVALGQKLPQDVVRKSTKMPPLFWSAHLSSDGSEKQPAYSIYSGKEIKPILPNFQLTN